MSDVALLIGAFITFLLSSIGFLSDTGKTGAVAFLVVLVGSIVLVGWAMRGLVGV